MPVAKSLNSPGHTDGFPTDDTWTTGFQPDGLDGFPDPIGPRGNPFADVGASSPQSPNDSAQRVLSEPLASKATVATIGTTTIQSTEATSGGSSTTSPFVINVTWDASIASAPAGFTAGVTAAVQWLESQFVNPATINIDVGYGEINGAPLGSNELGESYYWLNSLSYSSLVGALRANATSPTAAAAVASLPPTSPVNGTFWATTAQEKALGLTAANGAATDGYVGFSSSLPFTYNDSNGVAAGTYDFTGTVLHEITEVMGRALETGGSIGSTANSYYADDLFHYSAPGVRDFSASTPGYFSVDGGATNLGGFNTVPGGDAGDWGSNMGNDSANAFSSPGVVNTFSSSDLATMNAIGWEPAGSVPPPLAPPPPLSPPPPVAPTGVSIAALATSLANAVTMASPVAKLTEIGGTSGDTFAYQLGGTGASAFSIATANNVGTLMSGASGLTGSTNGTMYALTVTATDTTANVSSPGTAVDVVVGTTGTDTISLATLSANLGMSTPTFAFGRGSNDAINGTGMTGAVWFSGGAGADRMTAGTGADTFVYGSVSDSTASAMDVISGFNAGLDKIDLSGLGFTLAVAGAIKSNGKGSSVDVLAGHSVGWQTSGNNTIVYVNTSSAKETTNLANMEIKLVGSVSLSSSNIIRA